MSLDEIKAKIAERDEVERRSKRAEQIEFSDTVAAGCACAMGVIIAAVLLGNYLGLIA